jgi:Uma2 family endonuclease
MSTVEAPVRYTPEDLLRRPDGKHFELVDGQLVEQHMSFWSGYVTCTMLYLLRVYCQTRPGWVLSSEVSYQCFPDAPKQVRRPDASFIRLERMPFAQALEEGHILIAPDLAVEVLSPNDLAYEVDAKVQEYLNAGVHLVWVINPATRTVRVHRATGPGTILREDDELTGEDVLPGFRCRVAELFQPPLNVPPAVSPPA